MSHQPERTCIGCRGVFKKKEVVRIVAGSGEFVIDYREKLPGRAAYVCPRSECIRKALGREGLPRSLRIPGRLPEPEAFIALLVAAITEKAKSLISMAAKAGKLVAGYSAVHDALVKGRMEMILYASDIADGTREKITAAGASSLPHATLFTREELGSMLGRELVGVIGIADRGLADALQDEARRLKSLINSNE